MTLAEVNETTRDDRGRREIQRYDSQHSLLLRDLQFHNDVGFDYYDRTWTDSGLLVEVDRNDGDRAAAMLDEASAVALRDFLNAMIPAKAERTS